MCIGNPRAGKSPAIDAVLAPLRRAEHLLRQAAQVELDEWEARQKLAKLAQDIWDKKARAGWKRTTHRPRYRRKLTRGVRLISLASL